MVLSVSHGDEGREKGVGRQPGDASRAEPLKQGRPQIRRRGGVAETGSRKPDNIWLLSREEKRTLV